MVGTGLPLSSHELHLRTQGVTKLKVADNKTTFNGGYVVIDNAGTSTTSTVNGAVTSNTSVTLSAANSDITTGMEVTGTGINGSPTVSSGTSLTLSSQQTLADAVVLTFTQPKATLGTESRTDLFTFSTTGYF